MPSTIEKLQAEAMILSPADRADLADRLLASIEPQADIGAAGWYSANAGRTAAANFSAAYDTVANLISGNPGIGTPSAAGTRTLRFRGFPYSLVYRLHSDHAVVIAVAHQRRRPRYWAKRR